MDHTLTLLRKEEIVPGVFVFIFNKPKNFTYKAGQFIEINLPSIEPHFFSLASAPYEDYLLIATRYRKESIFKEALYAIPEGTGKVTIKGPYGNFTLQDNTTPVVFLAGGIGITPFFSIIKQATYEKLAVQIYLFYINKTTEDAVFFSTAQKKHLIPMEEPVVMQKAFELVCEREAFVKKLTDLQIENPHFIFASFFPLPATIQNIPSYTALKYYLCGSPQSITRFKTFLETIHVPKEQIKTEDFPGYPTLL